MCMSLLCNIKTLGKVVSKIERANCFTLTVFPMSCDSVLWLSLTVRQCSIALSQSTMGWSAVCDCDIPDHTH